MNIETENSFHKKMLLIKTLISKYSFINFMYIEKSAIFFYEKHRIEKSFGRVTMVYV